MIIGICGWIGSGKDSVADYLVSEHGFKRDSFAGSLKDAISVIFNWDRELLEGRTKEAREWRETVDTWWASRLGIPDLTPRKILQLWGTEVCRKSFHDDIWISSLENKIRNVHNDIVITDCRFPNEIKSIRDAGGYVMWVQRGPLPSWYDDAVATNKGESNIMQFRSDVHPSEWRWVGSTVDVIIENNSSFNSLYEQVENFITEIKSRKT